MAAIPTANSNPGDWLVGGGEMGDCLRAKDWSQTPLGPMDQWPPSLRTTVSLVLNSNFPISLAWGPQHIQIYNDGYWPICAAKHPHSMGQDFSECWATAFPVIGDAFRSALAGTTAFLEDQRMFLDRLGFLEETFFTFSFSPIRDEAGRIVGLFHPVTETTAKMIGQRRTRCLRDLAARGADAKAIDEGFELAAQVLAGFGHDLPFALFYRLDGQAGQARLVARCGVAEGAALCASDTATLAEEGMGWPLAQLLREGRALQVDDVVERFGEIACGDYPEAIRSALLMPVPVAADAGPGAVLVLGISPRLPLNETYRGFLELVGAAVNTVSFNAAALEAERRRADALAAIDRAKTEFFNNISHEFRTPLTLILGPLEDELAEQADPLPAPRHARLETAHRNSLRLLKLVNTLLDFARLEGGRMVVSTEATDLGQLTADLAGSFRSACERAGLRLIVDSPSSPVPLQVDRDMWEKIVLNLLTNAFNYTEAGEIRVTLKMAGNTARLSVQDTGVGIAAEELGRIFERFYRVRRARGRSFEGTGIGLAMVQQLVGLHGGEVGVSSALGKGTTFSVTLPCHATASAPVPTPLQDQQARARRDAMPASQHPRVDHGLPTLGPAPMQLPQADAEARPRIIWADDNADMREYVRRLLAPKFDVEAVCNGEEALAAVTRQAPALVLSDVMMPRMDGFELLRILRSNRRTRGIPVVLLSARAGEEARVEGRATGADDYLAKPFSARELLSVVSGQVEMARLRRDLELAERQAEMAEAVRARDMAEAGNRAKSEFLANISHEIRTPLNAVIGLTHLLKRSPLNAQQTDRLRKIDLASHHLLAILNDVLDLSKIDAGRLELEQADFALGAVLDHVYSFIAEQASGKGLELKVDYSGAPEWLCGDATRLRQALLNYAGNALKFTDRGSIAIRASVEEDSGESLLLRFDVEDTGIGIAADVLPTLFEDFKQADTSITRRYAGTGLGLAVVRRLARLMGGDAGADSEPGRGSRFWFTARLTRANGIKQAPPLAAAGGSEQALRQAHAGARILLVEDVAINREVALELLAAVGLQADVAHSGAEAVHKVEQGHYDLVLMDVQMQGMSGIDATRVIRRQPALAGMPIIAMTANAFFEDRTACMAAGMNDHVAKPVDPELLYSTLLKWLPPALPKAPVPAVASAGSADAPPIERLRGIDGLDVAVGLKYLGGRVPTYLRLLRDFAQNHAGDLNEIGSLLAAGRMDDLRAQVHSMKGMSGTLGVARVQALAGEFERALLEAGPAAPELPAITDQATQLREALASVVARVLGVLGE